MCYHGSERNQISSKTSRQVSNIEKLSFLTTLGSEHRFTMFSFQPNFYRRIALAKQGDNALGSVHYALGSLRPSICPFMCAHYQSMVFVCVTVIRGHMLIIVQMRSIGF